MKTRKEPKQKGQLQTVVELLEQLLKSGTVLQYPVVNICSTESIDMAVLHKLHTQNRVV